MPRKSTRKYPGEGTVHRVYERGKKALIGTGLGISLLMVMVSFGFLTYPYIGLLPALGIVLVTVPLILLGTVKVVTTDFTASELRNFRIGIALISVSLGLISVLIAWHDEKYFWIVYDAISLVLSIRFIVQKARRQ